VSGLLALSSGSAAETRTLGDYRGHLAGVAYTGGPVEFVGADGVWVPEGTPRRRLAALAPALGRAAGPWRHRAALRRPPGWLAADRALVLPARGRRGRHRAR